MSPSSAWTASPAYGVTSPSYDPKSPLYRMHGYEGALYHVMNPPLSTWIASSSSSGAYGPPPMTDSHHAYVLFLEVVTGFDIGEVQKALKDAVSLVALLLGSGIPLGVESPFDVVAALGGLKTEDGGVELMKFLVSETKKESAADGEGRLAYVLGNALCRAVQWGNMAMARFLLQEGVQHCCQKRCTVVCSDLTTVTTVTIEDDDGDDSDGDDREQL